MASEAAQLAQLLLAAASGDGRVRGPAQEKLQELESRPGFVPVLLAAYADANIEAQGRYLAVLMCKNVIDRQWQPRSGTSIGALEKTAVKDQLLRLVKAATEGRLPHLVELTLVLRRVCRFDFPMHWEALTRFLVEELQAQRQRGFSESALAVVLVLHQVLKEQSTKRLMSSRREFHHVGKELIEAVGAVWALKMEHLEQLQHQGSMVDYRFWRLSRHLDGSFLLLLVHGVPHVHEHPTGPQMIQMVKDQVETLLVLLQTHSQQLIQCPFFLKNLKSVLKWWALLFHAHPLAFAAANVNAVLHCSVEVLRTLTGLNVSPEMRPWLEGLLRSQLLMLSHSFNTVTFRKGPQPNHQGAALEAARLCHSQFGDFLRAHSVSDLCELACRAALRLPQEEVQTWLSEPEDQLLGPQCQTELHQAGEACIKALGQAPLDQALVEHIAKRMQEETASAPSPNDSFDVVMRKDMLLSLLAFCHSQLTPHLQFQVMLAFILPIAHLVPHLQPQAPAMLLPVRLCSVLRTWAADIPSDALMPVLQLLQAFLSAESPKAVRLAALSPLRVMLERFSDHEAWTQVQGQLIDSSLALLSIVTSPEVQWRVEVKYFKCQDPTSGRELKADGVEIGALGPGLCALASPSHVVVHLASLGTFWTQSSFEHHLPGEHIEAVAISRSFVAIFVAPFRLLRLFTPSFIPLGVLAMPMDIVSMVACNHLLFCVFQARAKRDLRLHFSLFDVEKQEKLSSGRLPLSRQSTLRWIGFSADAQGPQPLALDSAGILRALIQNDEWVMSVTPQSWVPVAELDGDCKLWPVWAENGVLRCMEVRPGEEPKVAAQRLTTVNYKLPVSLDGLDADKASGALLKHFLSSKKIQRDSMVRLFEEHVKLKDQEVALDIARCYLGGHKSMKSMKSLKSLVQSAEKAGLNDLALRLETLTDLTDLTDLGTSKKRKLGATTA